MLLEPQLAVPYNEPVIPAYTFKLPVKIIEPVTITDPLNSRISPLISTSEPLLYIDPVVSVVGPLNIAT
jgi:hypothetical protein